MTTETADREARVRRGVADEGATGGGNVAERVMAVAAVQEQLGLKLQDDKAPLDVVVVQQLARPTENCVERCTRSVTRALQSRGRSFHMV